VKALLDTHVLVEWIQDAQSLSAAHRSVIEAASADQPLFVSDISLWEVATLVRVGRLRPRVPLRDWLEAAVAPPLVQRMPISPAVAAEMAALPTSLHRDPADLLLIASARVAGATLLTRDRRIIASGVVPTL
jgi:PIN domain nuclease of toxin-antitoxin system